MKRRPRFSFLLLLLAVVGLSAGWLAPAAWAQAQVRTARPAAPPDSLRKLSEEPRPPALAPVVAPTDTLVRISTCPSAGPKVRVSGILFAGNGITKERTLRAELDFREGDSLTLAELPARLEANRRRVFNLQLFHAVLAQASCGGTGQLTVLFVVQERWYLLPIPILSIADANPNRWLDRPPSERWRRIDYGVHLVHNNMRGRAEQLTVNLQLGFNRKYELFYEVPGFGRRRRVGVGFGASYYQSRNLDYVTLDDKLQSLNPVEDNAFAIQRFYATGGLRLRHTVQLLSSLDVSYHREQLSDLIYQLNPAYYLGVPQREYLEATASTVDNRRNTFAYPLTGSFLQASVTFRQFLGNSGRPPAYATARLHYARYLSLGHGFYYALGLWAQARLLTQDLGYGDSHVFGYDALVRGYDRYVVEGQHYCLVQQGLSYRAWAPPPIHLPFLGSSKINTLPIAVYFNAFADAGLTGGKLGYEASPTNRLPGQLLASAGLGLHLVTYYDRVFCFELARTLAVYPGTRFLVRGIFPI